MKKNLFITMLMVLAMVVTMVAVPVSGTAADSSTFPTPDKYVFINTYNLVSGVSGLFIDFPMYSYDATTGTLRSVTALNLTDATKVIMGSGTILAPSTMGGGASTRLTLYDTTSVDNLFTVDTDATVHYYYNGTWVVLKPGESWNYTYQTTTFMGMPGNYTVTFKITNYGLQDKAKIIMPTPPPTTTPSTPTATPTPTPTGTVTPTATATPTPTPTSAGAIKVQFFNGIRTPVTNTLSLNFKPVNTGTTAVNLSNVKMRYYLTNEGTGTLNFACDWATAGSSNITSTLVNRTGTNEVYLEIGFTSGAGSLAPGAGTEVKARVYKSDWTNFDQSNDYSFNSTAANYVDWDRVTGYLSGVLKWGIEPY